jgi:hypothetical protein
MTSKIQADELGDQIGGMFHYRDYILDFRLMGKKP